ncbi:MAG: GGDEF domain-containing protein [Defluviitaleaceae bacterium]|nr:GGDEF domain-containing protein [Defluviitaleaceae bacterium]
MKDNLQKGRRKHYGVMFSTMDNANQYELWRGVEAYASENDINLTAYIGAYQGADNAVSTFFETGFEAAYNSEFLDGFILFSGFVAQNAGFEKFNQFVAKAPKNLPIVSVSFALPNIPSILAESFNGIYSAVEHLIKVHGRKNIAFVKGPDGHPEAEERLAGYKKALADNGIEFDERYAQPGEFMRRSGEAAVATLIDTLKVPFDAVVSCNDQTAIGVLNELKARSIIVPSQVSVTGFDDDIDSAIFIPSLSTARQDFFELGQVSADTLTKIVSGEQVEEITHVAPFFVMRQSCGCLDKGLSESVLDSFSGDKDSLYAFILDNFTSLFTKIPKTQIEEWAVILNSSLKKQPFSKEKFLQLFNEILIKYNHKYDELIIWHEALNILTMGVDLHSDEIESAHSVLSTIVTATAFVHDFRFKEEKNLELKLEGVRGFIRRLTGALVLTYNMDSLLEKLKVSLPLLSMYTAFIGVYRSPIKREDPNADRTIETLIGFDDDTKFYLQNNTWNPIAFSNYPDFDGFNMERVRRSLFFIPLFFEDEELGVVLFSYESHIPVDAYENMRVSISTAVKGAELLSTIRTLSITDELTGLLNRRGFFQFVYSRILHLSRSKDIIPMVMFMDMDGLKAINDNHGHSEGDNAISAFANILKDALRKEDIIGRMGGDEFVVFSSVKSKENSDQVVQRIRDKIDEYNNKKLHSYLVSGSIGCVVLEEVTRSCFEEAMLSADSVLYEEKMMKKKKGLSRQ